MLSSSSEIKFKSTIYNKSDGFGGFLPCHNHVLLDILDIIFEFVIQNLSLKQHSVCCLVSETEVD